MKLRKIVATFAIAVFSFNLLVVSVSATTTGTVTPPAVNPPAVNPPANNGGGQTFFQQGNQNVGNSGTVLGAQNSVVSTPVSTPKTVTTTKTVTQPSVAGASDANAEVKEGTSNTSPATVLLIILGALGIGGFLFFILGKRRSRDEEYATR